MIMSEEIRAPRLPEKKPAKKWVKRSPRKGGGGIPNRDPFVRFAEKWKESENKFNGSYCYIWHGALQSKGYGCFAYGGRSKSWLAHKWAFVFIGEKEIPEDFTIDHLCRNRRCVNHLHMEAVTQKENTLRGNSIVAQNARATHCCEGHPFEGNNLLLRKDGRRICKTCHSARRRASEQRQHDRRIRKSLCPQCGKNPPDEGFSRCNHCREVNRNYMNDYNKRRRQVSTARKDRIDP